MTQTQVIAILFVVAFGLGIGLFTARASNKRESIHGGQVATFLHYLSSALLTAMVPTILVSLFIFHVGVLNAILLGAVLFASAFLLLIPFAAIEQPALQAYQAREDRGWTREDAETSGL